MRLSTETLGEHTHQVTVLPVTDRLGCLRAISSPQARRAPAGLRSQEHPRDLRRACFARRSGTAGARDRNDYAFDVVPAGHYLMIGDNRDNSVGRPRSGAACREENLVGKATRIWFNFDLQRSSRGQLAAESAMASSERHSGVHMMRNQRGVTMIGWIFLLIPMAVVIYAGIRVGPEYLNYYKVSHGAEGNGHGAQERRDAESGGHPCGARKAFRHRLHRQSRVYKEIAVRKGDKGWEMTADYEKAVPLFGNLYLLDGNSSKTVVIN